MRPDVGEEGHSRVQLHREGGGRRGDRLLVHRVILETFVGPAPTPETQGRHLDRNPQNNAARNLQWGDQPSNWQDSKRHGTHRRHSKLTHDDATAIRARHAAGETGEALAREYGVSATQIRNIAAGRQWSIDPPIPWPLANVWAGVSAEDQCRADERIHDLLATPAAVRFVSCEPLLGPVDLARIELVKRVEGSPRGGVHLDALAGRYFESGMPYIGEWDVDGPCPEGRAPIRLDWVIVGGESGPNARPMHIAWARTIRDQCAAVSVPFFFKQWGEFLPDGLLQNMGARGLLMREDGSRPTEEDAQQMFDCTFDYSGWQHFSHAGKRRAGSLLDGVEHKEWPR